MNVTHHAPEAVVSFYTEEGELIARTKPKFEEQGVNAFDGDVLRIVVKNDLAADAGTFEITLTHHGEWHKKVASNDLVSIIMRRNGEDDAKATVMVGLVDYVGKQVVIQDNTVQRVVSIVGRSLAKVAINFEIGIVPESEDASGYSADGWLAARGMNFAGKTAAEVFRQIVENLLFSSGKNGQLKYANYTFSNGKTIKDMLQLKLSSRKGEYLAQPIGLMNFQGSVHDFMKEACDDPFNQFFYEVYDGKPTLVLRETPFNPDKWNALPIHTITDDDVVSEQLGRSDLETYTMYSVGIANNEASETDPLSTMGVKPIWYEKYAYKYGLRRLHRLTNYAGISVQNQDQGGSGTTDATSKLQAYAKDLFNWNIMNPDFWSGTITVKGQCYYKIGDRLLYKSEEHGEDYEFFIEGVTHEFTIGEGWITQLSVTRGLPDSGAGRFKPPWGQGVPYEGGALGLPKGTMIKNPGEGDGWLSGSPPSVGSLTDTYKVARYYLSSTFTKTSPFGVRYFNGQEEFHPGVDLAAPRGTPVYALVGGRVENASWKGGYGNCVIIVGTFNGKKVENRYGHLLRFHVTKGQIVKPGQLIGEVDSTGRSTGNHVHIEWREDGKLMDPWPILQKLADK